MLIRLAFASFGLFVVSSCSDVNANEWVIPISGNAFRTTPQRSDTGFQRDGSLSWTDSNDRFSVYFRVDRPAELDLSIRGQSMRSGGGRLIAQVLADSVPFEFDAVRPTTQTLGNVKITNAGYVCVSMRCRDLTEKVSVRIDELIVSSSTAELSVDFVRSNNGNMFYWGRRGPSVHLRYQVPKDIGLTYAYSEVTVPEGQDPIGTFYMANGFGQGYFGFQVNSEAERRVLFSVWSPFKTDDPRDVPADQRITLLGKGRNVQAGKFGNEGSGGQSYLAFPWKAGVTYRFLTEVVPDGEGNTVYTSWFSEKESEQWRLIASFRRPKTDTHLTGFHSFLESFSPSYGDIGRRGQYGNVWVCDLGGVWYECVNARFSVDATGGGRHRLDFRGGANGNQFFLQNCGFFDDPGEPGSNFTRESSGADRPKIDLESLHAVNQWLAC